MLAFLFYVIVLPVFLVGATALTTMFLTGQRPALSSKNPKAIARPKETVYPEPHKMSWIGRRLMSMYNELPEANRPSYDFRGAIVALDVKYEIETLDRHFTRDDFLLTVTNPRCACTQNRSSNSKNPCKFAPEFIDLLNGMKEINRALKRVAAAEAERERKIELAGIENDLRSVDDILNSFRIEKEALYSTAKEISA